MPRLPQMLEPAETTRGAPNERSPVVAVDKSDLEAVPGSSVLLSPKALDSARTGTSRGAAPDAKRPGFFSRMFGGRSGRTPRRQGAYLDQSPVRQVGAPTRRRRPWELLAAL